MKVKRVSNADIGQCADNKDIFKTNNGTVFSEKYLTPEGKEIYVIYSYGRHFPMLLNIADQNGYGNWYYNGDKYSSTTSRHQYYARKTRHISRCQTISTQEMEYKLRMMNRL